MAYTVATSFPYLSNDPLYHKEKPYAVAFPLGGKFTAAALFVLSLCCPHLERSFNFRCPLPSEKCASCSTEHIVLTRCA